MIAIIGALVFLGCPWRMILRLAGSPTSTPTPRQAVATVDGLEKVEALLRDAELRQKRGFAYQTGDANHVRKELGII